MANKELEAFVERGIAFVAKVENRSIADCNDLRVYKDFIRVLEMCQKGLIKDNKTLLDNVIAIFTRHQELSKEFHSLFFQKEHEKQATVCGQKAPKTYATRKRKREEEKLKKLVRDLIARCFSDKTRDSNETCAASHRKDERSKEDLVLERFDSAIENLKMLEEIMNQNPSSNGETINIEEYLTPINLKCIEKLFDDHQRVDILKSLRSNPKSVLGNILDNLKEKKEYCEVILAAASYFETNNNNRV